MNLRFCLLMCSLCAIPFLLPAQSYSPGGVKGAVNWYIADSSATASMNFHPASVVDARHPLSISLGARDLRSSSYFTVYQSLDTSDEYCIWHITSNRTTTLVLTTDRMADLTSRQYMNYTDVIRSQPKVNIYVQHKVKDSLFDFVPDQQWNIGVKPGSPSLPVRNFRGYVPEIIAFDRVLNSRERLQTASYLALKYGVTLTEPGAAYLNSSGDKIWDGYDYKAWHHNIAGICRDDSGGLHQLSATSSNYPGLVTINTNDSLTDKSFLLWGDNGSTLTTGTAAAGMPPILKKTWLIRTYGNTRPFTTGLTIDTRSIDARVPVDPVYWLVVDPGGTGSFSASASRFIRMDRLDADGKTHFDHVSWDQDQSGKDVWSIIPGRDLMLATTIQDASCTPQRTGSLAIRILGGSAPYRLSIQGSAGYGLDRTVGDPATPLQISDLAAGRYSLKVTDARQQTYADSFYIQNQDAPLPTSVASSYTLPPAGTLQIDASQGMSGNLTWEWTGPGNYSSLSPVASVTTAGVYTLRCSKGGCSTLQDITVNPGHPNLLYDVTVYPNPSPAVYHVRVRMDDPADVTMTVFDPDGRMVDFQQGDNRANYTFQGKLLASGVYEVFLQSGLSHTSRKLIIAK